jgi:hypothetical protein
MLKDRDLAVDRQFDEDRRKEPRECRPAFTPMYLDAI